LAESFGRPSAAASKLALGLTGAEIEKLVEVAAASIGLGSLAIVASRRRRLDDTPFEVDAAPDER
jgi:hypothetical protein